MVLLTREGKVIVSGVLLVKFLENKEETHQQLRQQIAEQQLDE